MAFKLSLSRKKQAESSEPVSAEAPVAKPAKAKRKFDAAKLQTWLAQHVEKIVFGLFALVALYFVYGAVMRETFARTPDELEAKVTQAKTNLANSPPETAPKVPEYVTPAGNMLRPASHEGKLIARPWAPPVIPVDTRRGQPSLLPVLELQVAADYGGFKCRGPRPVRGFPWVVVTGLIPYEDQFDEYTKALGLAEFHGVNDVPVYDRYEIQRAEVTGDGENEQPQWATIATWPQALDPKKRTLPLLAPVMRDRIWEATAEDVVPIEYLLDSGMADPLGPLVNKTWGRSAGHEKFPMPKLEAASAAADAPAEGEEEAMPELDGEEASTEESPAEEGTTLEMEADEAATTAPAAAPPPTAVAAAPRSGGGLGAGLRAAQGAAPAAQPGRSGGLGAGLRAAQGAAPAAPGAAPGGNQPAAEAIPEDPKLVEARQYKLFRFFDFTVKPGVRYRYRVRLRTLNPNYEVEQQHLKADADSTEEYAWTPYSDASPMVTGARLNNVLVGPVASVDSRSSEAVLNVLVRQFDTASGADLSKSTKISRGQVANYREQVDGKNVEYRTNMLLVDLVGGEKISVAGEKQSNMPGIAAFLDPDGRLIVQTELNDAGNYHEGLTNAIEPDKAPRAQRQPAGAPAAAPAPGGGGGGLGAGLRRQNSGGGAAPPARGGGGLGAGLRDALKKKEGE